MEMKSTSQPTGEAKVTTHYWGYRELSAEEVTKVAGGDDGGDYGDGGTGDAGDTGGCDFGGGAVGGGGGDPWSYGF